MEKAKSNLNPLIRVDFRVRRGFAKTNRCPSCKASLYGRVLVQFFSFGKRLFSCCINETLFDKWLDEGQDVTFFLANWENHWASQGIVMSNDESDLHISCIKCGSIIEFAGESYDEAIRKHLENHEFMPYKV